MTVRAGRIAGAIDRIMGAVPTTPAAWADGLTSGGTAVTLGSMAVMGMAALARLDPAFVDGAVKGLWAGGGAFAAGLVGQAVLNADRDVLAGARSLATAGIGEKQDALARLDAEVLTLSTSLAPPEPDAPSPGMR